MVGEAREVGFPEFARWALVRGYLGLVTRRKGRGEGNGERYFAPRWELPKEFGTAKERWMRVTSGGRTAAPGPMRICRSWEILLEL